MANNDAAIQALLVGVTATNQKLDALISVLSGSHVAQPAGFAQPAPVAVTATSKATFQVQRPNKPAVVATSHRRGTGRKGESTWTNPKYDEGGREKTFTMPGACRNMAVGQTHTTAHGYVWTRLS